MGTELHPLLAKVFLFWARMAKKKVYFCQDKVHMYLCQERYPLVKSKCAFVKSKCAFESKWVTFAKIMTILLPRESVPLQWI